MIKQLLFAALGLAVASGCTEKQPPVTDIRIAPLIKTRVTGLHFDAGDQIGLSITKGSETYLQNRMMTYSGTAFESPGLMWYNDLNEKSTLTAYYPYSPSGVPSEFTVAADQSGGCASSDLLGAVKKEVTPSSAPIGMLFYHLMSQLTIVVANSSDAAVSEVIVDGFVPTAEVDLTAPTAMAKPGAASVPIKAFEVTPDATYRVVLVPQQGALTVTAVTSDGKRRSKTLASAALESGKRYDMSVTVTNIDISLTLSGDIGDWGEGGSLDGENGGGNEETSELVYEGVTYRTAKLGGRVWMAENLRFVPSGAAMERGVWYPQEGASAVEAQGLLYDYATATSGAAARAAEPLRGICPEGWHIPTTAELESLAAAGADLTDDFFSYPGFWIVNTSNSRYGNPDKAYLMGSDRSETGQCRCLSFTKTSALQSDQISADFGISLRCVKDEAVR